MARWFTHVCAPSLLIDVDMGQITHDHLVAALPAVHHHCVTKCVHAYSDITDPESASEGVKNSPAMRLLMVPVGTKRAASI